ncbi:protein kinase [Streptomyces sp. NPDC087856]|uniref:serine/threonine-protein kinase n=1 Tax=Streptomyces sp. NPDC087856 TaxID=3365811 RepID=UPI00382A8AEB
MRGVLLAGRFRIGDRLGAGGMGQVWAAQDERMRRDVAVKIVHPQYGMDEAETQARFEREVQLAGRLSHQNIVTVHDWGEVAVDGRQTLFLVMELVHGVPLHRRLAESTPPWPLAVGWGAQLAEALAAAHDEGVVHRDIKPANVLLKPSGTLKVLDFGVAKFMGETIGARELSVVGVPLGSPSYMSPEQADGDRAVDHRSDLYSLGCLLYHAVTGRPPFTGSSPWAVLRKHMDEAPVPPGMYVEELPYALNDLILSLLAKRPEDRPADGAAVCEALSTLLVDHAVTDPDGGTLDVVQLGHTHSVAGTLVKRAWELYQWTSSARRSDELLAEARKAKDLLSEANSEASKVRIAAAKKAEGILRDAERQKSALVREAEERWAEVVEGAYSVEAAKVEAEKAERRLADLTAAHERLRGRMKKDAVAADLRIEEDFYQVFKQSINGSYPAWDEYLVKVRATLGIVLQPDEAHRMVKRFVDRFHAELEEDHIA